MKKKIILINSCKGLYGGVESFLLNIFYSLDPNTYDVTFLTCGVSTYNMFREEIILRGGKIETIPIYANTLNKQLELYKELLRYFREKKPDLVHVNSGGLSFHYITGRAAKKSGIKEVVLHSHNFVPGENALREILKNPIKNQIVKYGTRFLACSKGAAYWIFPKNIVDKGKVEIIPNGIDTNRFGYSNKKRIEFRSEFGIKDELVIGNIGRFQPQKNHEFIIRIMREVIKKIPNAKLLLAGEGELKKHIEEMVKEYGIDRNVIFLGERKDMDALLSAMDIFIFPSLHEGFGIAAIEAQASGVKVLLAKTIPEEVDITGNVEFLPIINGVSEVIWAERIFAVAISENSNNNRFIAKDLVIRSGYDVNVYVNRMNHIYAGE